MAVHEAGHCVVAARLRIKVAWVSIGRTRFSDGRMLLDAPAVHDLNRVEARRRILIALAGSEAERIDGVDPGPGAADADEKLARWICKLHGLGPRLGLGVSPARDRIWLSRVRREVRRLLTESWADVESVASQLLASGGKPVAGTDLDPIKSARGHRAA